MDILIANIYSRLTAFRNEVVAKDMIVPAWVVASIEEIEAAQPSGQDEREKEHKHDFKNSLYCHICGQSEF